MGVYTCYKQHCIYLPAMAGWFICSAGLSSYNKVVFGENHGAFPCPLLLTSMHFFIQWVFSYTVSTIFPEFFGGEVVLNMSWKTYLGQLLQYESLSCILSFQPLSLPNHLTTFLPKQITQAFQYHVDWSQLRMLAYRTSHSCEYQ